MKTGHATIECRGRQPKKPPFSIGQALYCFAGAGLFSLMFAVALAEMFT